MAEKQKLTVRVYEWVLQTQGVTIEVGPGDDIENLAGDAALEQDDWQTVDSKGFEYMYKSPYSGKTIKTFMPEHTTKPESE